MFGMRDGDRLHVARIVAAVVILGWLLLLLICLASGTAFGNRVQMPFLRDFFAYGRYLVAAPLLLLMNLIVERQSARALAYLHDSGLIADSEGAVRDIVGNAARVWQSTLLRSVLIVLTYLSAAFAWRYARAAEVSTWMFSGEPGAERLSIAGTWNMFVGGALVKFLFLRAMTKWAIWQCVLWRVSRLPLALSPLHPDRCCGLRALAMSELAFAPLFSAMSVQLGCGIAVNVRYHGMAIADFQWMAAVFVAL